MRFVNFLFSGAFMGILLTVFAISIGYATFIENDFDAATAKMLVYNARWFEVLMFLMVANFSGMIFTRQLYKKNKINILLIHVSLIIIVLGAAITRYIGFEGQMHIRQGQTTNRYQSADSYFTIHAEGNGQESHLSKRIWLSPKNKQLLSQEFEFGDATYDFSIDNYMPSATQVLVPDLNGAPMLSLVSAAGGARNDTYLTYGESTILNDIGISFGDTTDSGYVHFILRGNELLIRIPEAVASPTDTVLANNGFNTIGKMQVISLATMRMVVLDYAAQAILSYVPVQDENQPGESVAQMHIKNQHIYLKWNEWSKIIINGVTFSAKLGSQTWELPFSLRLNEFHLERYPGSMSPSSFASEITLIDQEKSVEKPYRIYMNNILSYGGYRFYQSSYDTDELGTILSVNHDYWGTIVTYIGYFLLFATLIISLFIKKNRFDRVSRQIAETHELRKKMLLVPLGFLLFFAGTALAQDKNEIDPAHATSFGKLLVQTKDGRIVPVNTIASQVLVKVYKKSSFEGLSAEQVFLGMLTNPEHWQHQEMVKVADPALQSLLSAKGQFARYIDFFDANGQYKLKVQVDEAYAKKPALRNMFDKELIYVDERLNVCYLTFSGSYLKFYPITGHPDQLWISPMDMDQRTSPEQIKAGMVLLNGYFQALRASVESGNFTTAEQTLQSMKDYQAKEGAEILPSGFRVNIEVLYNNLNIFKKLFPVFMMLGIVLFALMFVQIFQPKLKLNVAVRITIGLLIVAFILQSAGLVMRWIIAEHAPWSNGYESMIYISWATMLAGFVFMKKSPIILSVTALLCGVTLLTAHMSWLNPEITNLVPVLKSYWLTIHVATITASYGFIGLGSLTGFLNLCIMIFRSDKNKDRVNLVLKELTLIIELSLSVGLILLIIGNFLGGIWANESWGRYWGWDPKETWSLVTIIVFTFILHMRLIPGLRNTFSFNFLAMFGFSSVLMTYFGVNYYLSGLHSYASGDPVPVPNFVYYSLGIMLLISALAAYNDYKIKDQSPMMDEEESLD
ncbi:MAG: cytochrome c biogenesis protein CcsA [Cyclobacteriaceae bacterium]|nr:cytochrome c biogenesis protein CcsA [Cyclobacteriaceae bacterium]